MRVTYCAEWMRIAIATFVSAQTTSLIAIKNPGEFRYYFGQRFKGILDLVIKNADRTNSAVPTRAKERIKVAWNVEGSTSERSEVESRSQEPAETPAVSCP
jgi:hypothetical protein